MTIQNPLINYDDQKWALIPSDPAIFNDMIQQYGVKDINVEEICSLDFEEFKKEGKAVHGLMFISKYIEEELHPYFDHVDSDVVDVVFTAQVVTNVCATLALLAILFNSNIEKGDILTNFLKFTEGFSPIDRGLCLGSSKEIREIHNAYACNANQLAETALLDSYADTSSNSQLEYVDAENFHYISYIFKNGFLWELDGLKYYPVKLAECTEENWLTVLRPILEKKMNSSNHNDIQFSLLAITHDSYSLLKKQNEVYTFCLDIINKIIDRDPPFKKSTVYYHKKRFFEKFPDATIPLYDHIVKLWENVRRGDYEAAAPQMHILQERLNELDSKLKYSQEEKEIAHAEVTRQKFDYFPFLASLFKKGYKYKLVQAQPTKKVGKKKTSLRGTKRATRKRKIVS
ncbi:uncharacterized protein BX663DRAFT_512622 [Cokeromyces recurvatus]|uniref:uncharacterized protein n=1 Tax=Cokeromyces recurvatus TaxID=90255 RepID=UPI00222121BF|nr:uncharacterized protein BX663DRAFT_512622 [Cokeromyces recurvatus]KAI7901852.1 hypothetical protein BX663DRAFT_512622 [Cokeromyces recurvatus]